MLIKLAWRNIWRNSRRSIIILVSVIVGLAAIVIYDSVSVGMIQQMLENRIGAHISHIQIHKQGFNDNRIIQNYIPNPQKVKSVVRNHPHIQHYSKRVITFGLLNSAYSSSGVSLVGINPEQEKRITIIKESIAEGRYLSGEKHEIVMGKSLAEKLDVGLGDKVVAMASTLKGNVGSDVFRIVGLFETFNSEFDKIYAYIPFENAQRMLGLNDNFSEFALLIDNLDNLNQVEADLEEQLNFDAKSASKLTYEVLTFKELLPLLVMQVDVYKESIFIFYGIIAVAMIFGIVNTMLMSVFERIREFGVLMAIGMKNKRIFVMVILEALFLGVFGTAIGFLVSYLIYIPLSNTGIDLSMFSDSLKSFGVGTTIYPAMTLEGIMNALFIVPLVTVLGAIYPALKAIRLEPMNAIRYV